MRHSKMDSIPICGDLVSHISSTHESVHEAAKRSGAERSEPSQTVPAQGVTGLPSAAIQDLSNLKPLVLKEPKKIFVAKVSHLVML